MKTLKNFFCHIFYGWNQKKHPGEIGSSSVLEWRFGPGICWMRVQYQFSTMFLLVKSVTVQDLIENSLCLTVDYSAKTLSCKNQFLTA